MTPTVHAVFENGVFRPLEPVKLPESCEVAFEPRLISAKKMDDVYRVLGERYSSGERDVAEHHNEHQP